MTNKIKAKIQELEREKINIQKTYDEGLLLDDYNMIVQVNDFIQFLKELLNE